MNALQYLLQSDIGIDQIGDGDNKCRSLRSCCAHAQDSIGPVVADHDFDEAVGAAHGDGAVNQFVRIIGCFVRDFLFAEHFLVGSNRCQLRFKKHQGWHMRVVERVTTFAKDSFDNESPLLFGYPVERFLSGDVAGSKNVALVEIA